MLRVVTSIHERKEFVSRRSVCQQPIRRERKDTMRNKRKIQGQNRAANHVTISDQATRLLGRLAASITSICQALATVRGIGGQVPPENADVLVWSIAFSRFVDSR